MKTILEKSVDNLVWDVDGTLWWNQNLGLKIREAYIIFLAGKLNKPVVEVQSIFEKGERTGKSWSNIVCFYTGIAEEGIIKAVDQRIDKTKFLKEDKKLVSFFKEFLSKYNNFILTNSTKRQTDSVLKRLGFSKNRPFKKIFSIDTILGKKPSLLAFEQVIQYGTGEAKNYLMIGDSVKDDIIPAKKLGMKTCLLKGVSEEADICLDNLYEIKSILS